MYKPRGVFLRASHSKYVFARGLFDFRFLFPDRSKSPRSRKSTSDLYSVISAINDGPLPNLYDPGCPISISFPNCSVSVFLFLISIFFSLFFSSSRSSFVCATTFTCGYTCTLYTSARCLSTSTHIPYKRLSDVVVIARGRTENRSSIYNTV